MSSLDQPVQTKVAREGLLREYLPLLTVIVALAGVLSTTAVSIISLQNQRELTEFQVTYASKQQAYGSFLEAVNGVIDTTFEDNLEVLRYVNRVQTTYFLMEPYLSEEARSRVYDDILGFLTIVHSTVDKSINEGISQADRETVTNRFLQFRQGFRDVLIPELFNK